MTNPSKAGNFKFITIFPPLTRSPLPEIEAQSKENSLVIVSGTQFLPLPQPFSMALGKSFRRGFNSPGSSCLKGRDFNYLVIQVPFAVSVQKALSKGLFVLAVVSPPKTVSKSLAAGAYLVLLPMPRVSQSGSD